MGFYFREAIKKGFHEQVMAEWNLDKVEVVFRQKKDMDKESRDCKYFRMSTVQSM